tara:strand:+ start:641 stop:1429 length:789 start_codon:yes stop_codon:yes gene_type:complete
MAFKDVSFPPPNQGKAMTKTNLDKYRTDYLDNVHWTGMTGVRYFQYEMARYNMDVKWRDGTFDCIMPDLGHRIEIKTARPHVKGQPRKCWSFYFQLTQSLEHAFDYAVCVGCDDDYKVQKVFVIPQPYIYELARKNDKFNLLSGKTRWNHKVGISIPIEPAKKGRHLINNCDTYKKWEICEGRYELLSISQFPNKSYFNKRKKQLTNQLLNYEKKCLKQFDDKVSKLWHKGYSNVKMMEVLGCVDKPILDAKKRLGLKGRKK